MDQPLISEDNAPFVVKVKNLSNQVFEFTVDPQMKVDDFKVLIKDRVNVPVQRQRLVFGGKQLLDDQPINEYLKQSGLTIHIIAKKINTQQEPTQPAQNTSREQPRQQNFSPPPQFNPFAMFSRAGTTQQMPMPMPMGDFSGLMSDVMGLIGNDLNSSNPPNIQEMFTRVTGSMGSLIERQQQRRNSSQQGQQPQQPQQSQQSQQPIQNSNQQIPQQQSTQSISLQSQNPPSQQQQISMNNQGPLRNLNQAISHLPLPRQIQSSVSNNPRHQLSGYLNNLQLQMMRVLPRLHSQIQLINQGNTANLQQFREVFKALNRANDGALQAIDKYLERSRPQQQPQSNINNHQFEMRNESVPLITATSNINITLSSLNRDNEPQSRPSQINGPNIQTLFSGGQIPQLTIPPGILQMLNAQNILPQSSSPSSTIRVQTTQSTRQPQNAARQNQQERRQQNNQPQPNIMVGNMSTGNFNNMGNMMGNMGGMGGMGGLGGNIGGLFSMLGSMGGPTDIGGLMNMKINDIVKKDQSQQQENVYTHIFGPLRGSHIMSFMTTGNTAFLLDQHKSMRQGLIKAQKLCDDNEEQLIKKLSQDIISIFLTEQTGKKHLKIANYVQLMFQREIILKKVKVYIKQLHQLMMQQSPKSNYPDQFKRICTMMLGSIVHHLVEIEPQHKEDVVFQSVKQAVLEFLDPYIPGLSFMFYMILEKDIKSNYNIYKADYERQQQKTQQDVLNEQNLLKSIGQQAKRDAQQYQKEIAGKKRSKYYEPQ